MILAGWALWLCGLQWRTDEVNEETFHIQEKTPGKQTDRKGGYKKEGGYVCVRACVCVCVRVHFCIMPFKSERAFTYFSQDDSGILCLRYVPLPQLV